jgi:hypothetical protein
VAAARQQIEDDLEADAALLGLTRKKKPAGDATAAGASAGDGGDDQHKQEQDDLVRLLGHGTHALGTRPST